MIGGSKLFHASVFWSADVASRIVDLVHFTSPAMENNDIVRLKAKEKFWDGIVVPFEEVENYISEDDAILIGPGMPRDEGLLSGEQPTAEIVNYLLAKFPKKRWVVDGGALQECDPTLLTKSMILTPHLGELAKLANKLGQELVLSDNLDQGVEHVQKLSACLGGATILAKNISTGVDVVVGSDGVTLIHGGNQGLTKGGTGDVLAGLVVALYAKNDPLLSATSASFLLKQTAESLGQAQGVYYNTSDLVSALPGVWNKLVTRAPDTSTHNYM